MTSPGVSVREKVSPVFVGKFCREMEVQGMAVLEDVAAAFNLAEQFKIFRWETLFVTTSCQSVRQSCISSVCI